MARLDTILDSDRVLVLQAGRVVETGPPAELLAKPAGPQAFFRAMMAQTSS
jgi:ABC-type multidrug transport system fused ATPase/permease subunit